MSRRRTGGRGSRRSGSRNPVRYAGSNREADLYTRVRPFRGADHGSRRRSQLRQLFKGAGYEIAASVEALIAAGHSCSVVWDYTPRQMAAYAFLAAKRKDRESHTSLGLMLLAQSGDAKAIKTQFEDWERDA